MALSPAPAIIAALLTSCVSMPRPDAGATQNPTPIIVLDATYDWQVLVTVPWRSLLKEVPGTLHEVLQFQDDAHREPPGDFECYSVAAPPRFMASTPDEYLLCFTHDRLSRIEATVRLREAQAADLVAGACARWAGSASRAQAAPPAPASSPLPPATASSARVLAAASPLPPAGSAASFGGGCEGADGAIRYRASVEAAAGENEVLLTIRLEPGDKD